ncbi:hypothetical protein BGY98DRAFT_934997 [Russula aff. rugulosa BPL654]|nr:hypothetical protein BGY98DRAFT_934997 [Russula aff. rugulosa BPL654]
MTSAEITLGITTHQGNKEAHLRAIVKPRHYRSSATVTTELLAKVDKAKVLTDIYERKLAVIGRLENKMADEDKQMDLNVARPSEKTPQKILKINQSKGDGSEDPVLKDENAQAAEYEDNPGADDDEPGKNSAEYRPEDNTRGNMDENEDEDEGENLGI